ncbi:MAG: hypothetical protein ACLP8S_18800 [Solirubrobacteraceae bacterium]
MTPGVERLIDGLRGLGLQPFTPEPEFVAFPWEIELGSLVGESIELGFRAPADFPLSAPGGLLVRPHVLPFNQNGGQHPYCGVHLASTGGVGDFSWQYWSRPHPNWAASNHTVGALMAHVRHLFDTLPIDLRLPHAA